MSLAVQILAHPLLLDILIASATVSTDLVDQASGFTNGLAIKLGTNQWDVKFV